MGIADIAQQRHDVRHRSDAANFGSVVAAGPGLTGRAWADPLGVLPDVQKDSALTRWYRTRTEGPSGARKTTMIVVLARKLLIALWRLVTTGEVPDGVELRPEVAAILGPPMLPWLVRSVRVRRVSWRFSQGLRWSRLSQGWRDDDRCRN